MPNYHNFSTSDLKRLYAKKVKRVDHLMNVPHQTKADRLEMSALIKQASLINAVIIARTNTIPLEGFDVETKRD